MKTITSNNVTKAPEAQHRVSAKDNEKINYWLSGEPEWEGLKYVPTNFTGMTLETVSEAVGPMDFSKETLMHLVELLFPRLYEYE